MTYEPKEREILDQVVAALHGHYGERLSRVVLFGSRAPERRSAKVVNDFSRQTARKENAGTLHNNHPKCRKALECGGLTPLFLPRDSASCAGKSSQAKQRRTLHQLTTIAPPKAKAWSSPRTPKAVATFDSLLLLNDHFAGVRKMVSLDQSAYLFSKN